MNRGLTVPLLVRIHPLPCRQKPLKPKCHPNNNYIISLSGPLCVCVCGFTVV